MIAPAFDNTTAVLQITYGDPEWVVILLRSLGVHKGNSLGLEKQRSKCSSSIKQSLTGMTTVV